MTGRKTLRIKVNPQSAIKLANLVSNGALLLANSFVVGSNLRDQLKGRKRERIAHNLQTVAEITGVISALVTVAVEALEQHRAPAG